MQIEPRYNAVTSQIIGAAIDIHRAVGPGLLESAYMECMKLELTERELPFVTEHVIPLVYKGVALDTLYRVDLIVEDIVVVEVKSVAAVLPVHKAQLLTYMKLTACPLGLVINFNEVRVADGVHRLVNPAFGAKEQR